jgi:hypothetical protein
MHIETSRFELEICDRLFYLRADLGRRRLAICKLWSEAWRHLEFEWYDRAQREEALRQRREQRLVELETADPAAAFKLGMELEQVDRTADRSAEVRREVSSR